MSSIYRADTLGRYTVQPKAINKTTCAFGTDKTRLASKTVIEILSILLLCYFK